MAAPAYPAEYSAAGRRAVPGEKSPREIARARPVPGLTLGVRQPACRAEVSTNRPQVLPGRPVQREPAMSPHYSAGRLVQR